MTTGIHLTDGVITLRLRTLDDIAAQIAGQDHEMQRWLGWDPATAANVTAMIEASMDSLAHGVMRFDLGIRDTVSDALIGNSLANFADPLLAPGEVNIAYAVFPAWRGRGVAGRVVDLLCDWLRPHPAARTAVLKIDAGNTASRRVAERAGFERAGFIADDHVSYDRYVRDVT